MSKAILTADLDWQYVDGIEIPVSKQFGDIYFSRENGLLETQHVFIEGNDLAERLSQLQDYEYFCVGETGFGTGLNILALWQLWQSIRPNNHSHLHVMTVEKFPLLKQDLIRALAAWPELAPLTQQLIQKYSLPISGCHRLSFPEQRFSIDLWLGNAHEIFSAIPKTKAINAWFLDGFAPARNPELWNADLLKEIVRLSEPKTTFASFSVAGSLRRGLEQLGIHVSRVKGFGHKKEMLKAVWECVIDESESRNIDIQESHSPALLNERVDSKLSLQRRIAVIGAGIAGLSTAWAIAQRGHQVVIYDQSEPIAGASGNPLALLNPRLNPLEKLDDHLMTVSWVFALNHYAQFKAFTPLAVNQYVLKNPEESLQLAQEYPKEIFDYKTIEDVQTDQHIKVEYDALCFQRAGKVIPNILKNEILAHPLIQFKQIKIDQLQEQDSQITLYSDAQVLESFDHVVVCCALNSPQFFKYYPALKPNRGQVSWMNNQTARFDPLVAHSYGGYCAQIDDQHLILGASFFPHRADDDVLLADHQHNLDLFKLVFPEQASHLPELPEWHGRASVRAQSLDYFPLVGKLELESEIYTMSGLGSKGYLYAPLCAEILASQILNEVSPVNMDILKKVNPRRFIKKVKPKKPYYQKPTAI